MTDDARQRILGACYKTLLHIARMLLATGIGYREFENACRKAFVKAASSHFGLRGRETNASRIAAMTGIPRKQVQELRKHLSFEEIDTKQLLSPLADLMGLWASSERYRGEDGQPVRLSVNDIDGISFVKLVRECMGDVPPGAVRSELLRLGAIAIEGDNHVRLKRRSLIPEDVDSRLESAIAYSLRGLVSTIAHNSDPEVSDHDRRFERFVESRPLTEAEANRFRKELVTRLTEITEELDQILNEPSLDPEVGKRRRIGIGIYYAE